MKQSQGSKQHLWKPKLPGFTSAPRQKYQQCAFAGSSTGPYLPSHSCRPSGKALERQSCPKREQEEGGGRGRGGQGGRGRKDDEGETPDVRFYTAIHSLAKKYALMYMLYTRVQKIGAENVRGVGNAFLIRWGEITKV